MNAAVHGQNHAGDKLRIGEVEHGVNDVLDLADPSERLRAPITIRFLFVFVAIALFVIASFYRLTAASPQALIDCSGLAA